MSPKAPQPLERVRTARRDPANNRPGYERAPGDFNRVSVPTRDGDQLCDWLVAEDPEVVIEVGLAYGASALAIAEALLVGDRPDPAHIIIDPYQDRFNDAGWAVLDGAGLADMCTLDRRRSQLALADMASRGVTADVAFVDGSHTFHNVFVDLFFLSEIVRPGGLVILDDCDWPAVAIAASCYETNMRWRAEPGSTGTRLRAFRLPTPRYEPRFDEFKPFGADPHR
ncbi:MAG: class I SAM-dependent methyltransferase [bacterium]|nr:class I SAM-dependent methyltransferase [bacterium]